MNTKERFPISSHEVTNSRSESFDYKKYGIEPIVKSNSLDGDNFSTPHEWTPAGRAEKVNDARDAVAIAFGDKPPALARQESNTGRQLLVGEAYKAATDGGAAPTNERASTRRVLMTGEKITGKLPSHADAERGPQSVDEMLNRRADLLAKGVPEDLVDGIVSGEHNRDRGDNLVQYASRPPVEQAVYEQPAIREESDELVSRETSASDAVPKVQETPLPPHAEIPKAETDVAKPPSEPEPKASKENTPPETARNESSKAETTEAKPATNNSTAEKNPAEQVERPAEDKTSPVEQPDGNQKNTVKSEADVSKSDGKQDAGEQSTKQPGERQPFNQERANKWAEDFLRAYGRFLGQNVRAELADRLKAKGGLNVDAETLQTMSRLAKEANPRSPIWQTEPGSGSTLGRAADEARSRLQSIVESL
ncbi:hypothetical protein HG431_001830 [Candidatus Saccharibacteria bacterium]|nr:hypothetical protein [Candidatus Saccharibacteria bacterium]